MPEMRAQERKPCQYRWHAARRQCHPLPACEGCDGDGTRWVTVGALLEWSGHGDPQTYVVEGACPGCDHPACRDCRVVVETAAPCVVPHWIDFRPCDEDRPCGDDCNGDTTRVVTAAVETVACNQVQYTVPRIGACPVNRSVRCEGCNGDGTKTVTDVP